MALLWVNPATSNRFANKHLHVVPGSPTLQQLIDEGRRIFAARVAAHATLGHRPNAAERALREQYGTAYVTRNTLIALNTAGLQALEAAIRRNGYRSGVYDIRSGVIFNMTDTGCSEALVASIDLGIRRVARTRDHEVYHLAGAVLRAPLRTNIPVSAYSQITVTAVPGSPGVLGMKFTPTTAELANAKAGLRRVTPT